MTSSGVNSTTFYIDTILSNENFNDEIFKAAQSEPRYRVMLLIDRFDARNLRIACAKQMGWDGESARSYEIDRKSVV